MLGDLEGALVVDAFAGSGALGLEALSRGAERSYFFDVNRKAVDTVRENVGRLGVDDRAIVSQLPFQRGLKEVVRGEPDLWFMDPPYGGTAAREGLEAMADCRSKVTPGALVVWESDKDEELFEVDRFEITKERTYGRIRLVFFRCIDVEPR